MVIVHSHKDLAMIRKRANEGDWSRGEREIAAPMGTPTRLHGLLLGGAIDYAHIGSTIDESRAADRERLADGPPQRIRDKGQQQLPGDEAWLIGEHRMSGEKKYYLANLQRRPEIAPEPAGHGLPLSKCEAYNRVYEQSCGSS